MLPTDLYNRALLNYVYTLIKHTTEHTAMTKYSNRTVAATVQIIEGSDNQGLTVFLK